MKDNEINWDKPLIEATNAYLDSQDFADEFIEYLQLEPMEMLRQMGAI